MVIGVVHFRILLYLFTFNTSNKQLGSYKPFQIILRTVFPNNIFSNVQLWNKDITVTSVHDISRAAKSVKEIRKGIQ